MQSSCKSYVCLFSVFVFLNYLTTVTAKPASSPYSGTDNVVLNCGSSAISTDPDGKEWTGDVGSKFISSQPNETSTVSNSTSQSKSGNHVPYTTARIFVSQFTYSFLLVRAKSLYASTSIQLHTMVLTGLKRISLLLPVLSLS
jgi:hypothetical protein